MAQRSGVEAKPWETLIASLALGRRLVRGERQAGGHGQLDVAVVVGVIRRGGEVFPIWRARVIVIFKRLRTNFKSKDLKDFKSQSKVVLILLY